MGQAGQAWQAGQARRVRRTRVGAVAVALVVVVLGGACGGEGGGAAGEVTTTTSPSPSAEPPASSTTTTTEPMTDEEAILAAVRRFWVVVLETSSPPDPATTRIAEVATGEAETTAMETIRNRHAFGQAVRLPQQSVYRHDPVIESIGVDIAVVVDCGVDDGVLYDLATGEILNGEVQTVQWRTTLVRVDDKWLVQVNDVVDSWEGIAGCASAL